ncbi:hypothetical protein Rhe02_09500 [Rhizocola hellebori]|uniref:Uncharacterized protein n=1 Tax=Rhizocola hellebori TaxID=1392758 RepID=A0A8J3Q2U4_9ACTN|nr:hypothetical protein [Rhizocola hellebori]GIH02883.1 hypothetical protein Rhe02_09500 [Rhizocola hellebori]
MVSPPFRPARDIAINARRTGRDDPSNYDSTTSTPSDAVRSPMPQQTVSDSRLGRPLWWSGFTKAVAGAAGAGGLLFVADLHLLGMVLTATSIALWGLARIAVFYDNDLP